MPQGVVVLFEEAAKFMGKGVVGVDLARVFGEHELHQLGFDRAKKLKLPITVHAGEIGQPELVGVALDLLHADRIGHGVHAVKDPLLLKRLVDQNIPLEVCLGSNLISNKFFAGTYHLVENHPVRELLDMGVKVTINTDNRTIGGTTMCKEYEMLTEFHGFGVKEFKLIYTNAMEAAFASEDIKEKLAEFLGEFGE